jgi:hypothetical protein
MGPGAPRLPRWLAHGVILGIPALVGTYAVIVGIGLNRPFGCGTGNSYVPGELVLILMLLLLSGLAGWWTIRTGASVKDAALAGLVVGAFAGIVGFVAVSSSVPQPPPGCPQIPAFVRDNYPSIALQTRISALLELAALGLLSGFATARSYHRWQTPAR